MAEQDEHIAAAPAQDVFSLAVCVLEQLLHSPCAPFGCDVAQLKRIAEGAELYAWEVPQQASAGADDSALEPVRRLRAWGLLRQCLARQPEARPSAQSIIETMAELGDRTLVALQDVESGDVDAADGA